MVAENVGVRKMANESWRTAITRRSRTTGDRFKHSDFTVLTMGWNPNAKAGESFQCNFTHFFTKLMNSAKFNRYEFGEYTLVDSDLVTFE